MTRAADFLTWGRVLPARLRAFAGTGRSLRAAERAAGPIDETLAELRSQVHELRIAHDRLAEQLRVAQLDAADGRRAGLSALWVTNAPLSEHPLVSVVMPTYLTTRLEHLRSAVDSVLAQTYSNWELLIVDNSVEGMLATLPAWWPDDPRVRVLRSRPHNGSVARNEGLQHARGRLIAYLDDDCTWFPWWLRAVVVSFEGNPQAQFGYGVLLGGAAGPSPAFVNALPLTPLQLHLDNPIDTNHLVHRADLDERWDPEQASCCDYDLVQRLMTHQHVFVPVPACAYGTVAPDRTWSAENLDNASADRALMRLRARQHRPLRIVVATSADTLTAHESVCAELDGLRSAGCDLVVAASGQRASALADAMAAHRPDLVVFYGSAAAGAGSAIAADHGVPYAIRLTGPRPEPAVHQPDDLCIGTWPSSVPSQEWADALTRGVVQWHAERDAGDAATAARFWRHTLTQAARPVR